VSAPPQSTPNDIRVELEGAQSELAILLFPITATPIIIAPPEWIDSRTLLLNRAAQTAEIRKVDRQSAESELIIQRKIR